MSDISPTSIQISLANSRSNSNNSSSQTGLKVTDRIFLTWSAIVLIFSLIFLIINVQLFDLHTIIFPHTNPNFVHLGQYNLATALIKSLNSFQEVSKRFIAYRNSQSGKYLAPEYGSLIQVLKRKAHIFPTLQKCFNIFNVHGVQISHGFAERMQALAEFRIPFI